MVPLEIVACLAGLLGLATAFTPLPGWLRVTIALVAVAASGAALAVAPVRWQLVPVLVGALLLLAVGAGLDHRGVVLRAMIIGATTLAMVIGAALLALMPLRFLPAPTGAHRIGTTVLSVTDGSRPEIFLPGSGRPRTLTVQLWYPTDAAGGRAEPYLRDPHATDGLADYAGLPHFLLAYLHAARTHAITDAPIASGERLPVVFVLTGNLGLRQSQMVQVEELASHGYLVVGLDQPGTASSALLLDGTRVPYAGAAMLKPAIDQSIEPAPTVPTVNGIAYPEGLASYLAADPRAVLDHLTTLNAGDGALGGRLDLTRVGATGVSLGGYELAQWCATDSRLRACEFLDAPMPADAVASGLDAPALWLTRPASDMIREGWPPIEVRHYDGTQRAVYANTSAPAWYVTVAGVLHADLTDAPFGSPLFAWSGMTSASGDHVHEVMRSVTLAFFDTTLRGTTPGPVLDGSPGWSDVAVESHP